MNGAEALLRTLVDLDVEVCFANPGTSEMHTVAALEEVPAMRPVLALFEGVATGAADGYGRMAGRPAASLLHLGPGLANGLANLHNARRARTPLVNLVGDHATFHQRYDAPLQSDIASLARPVSGWYRSAARAEDLAADAAEAVAGALGPPGQVATLVVPADVAWSETKGQRPPLERRGTSEVATARIEEVAALLAADEPSALLLGGEALRATALRTASRVAAATGAALLAETFPARLERGAGLPEPTRLAYLPELAATQLAGLRTLVLVASGPPVSFFAYPGQPSDLVPDGCSVVTLAEPGHDVIGALEALAERTGAQGMAPDLSAEGRPPSPTGPLDAAKVAAAVGHLLPADAVVVDEANTSGVFVPAATVGCPPHDWLTLTGGAIGQGLPVATGAAVAVPGRKVVSLEADGSALYTLQALWTQAREGLDVTTVLYDNHAYGILRYEYLKAGGGTPPRRAAPLLELSPPEVDWVQMAQALGVPARRCDTGEQLVEALGASLAEPGPSLIQARVPAAMG